MINADDFIQRILESWNLGILESWNLGILESWNLGILELIIEIYI